VQRGGGVVGEHCGWASGARGEGGISVRAFRTELSGCFSQTLTRDAFYKRGPAGAEPRLELRV
jgi:hypothetical protein